MDALTERQAMNGDQDTPKKDGYFRRLRRRSISHLFKPVLPAAAPYNPRTDQNIAGSAPPLKACNDNQCKEGAASAEVGVSKMELPICGLESSCSAGCYVHFVNGQPTKIWCVDRWEWAVTPCP